MACLKRLAPRPCIIDRLPLLRTFWSFLLRSFGNAHWSALFTIVDLGLLDHKVIDLNQMVTYYAIIVIR